MIFFVAGDPGGSRALLPIIAKLNEQNIICRVLAHGFLGKEIPEQLAGLLCPIEEAQTAVLNCQVLVFGSSVNDNLPLHLARQAKSQGKYVVHVLDNWSSYLSRMCTGGQTPFLPDIYAVMDEYAYKEAKAAGIPTNCLVITGQPALATSAFFLRNVCLNRQIAIKRSILKLPAHKKILAFINEPFYEVFGANTQKRGHPGFTQKTVFSALVKALRPFSKDVYLVIAPHPKQHLSDVERFWHKYKGNLSGEVLQLQNNHDIFEVVDGVAGMNSLLLYEAWLISLPVFSLQPSYKSGPHRIAFLEEVIFADSYNIAAKTQQWIKQCQTANSLTVKKELLIHETAPQKLTEILLEQAGFI